MRGVRTDSTEGRLHHGGTAALVTRRCACLLLFPLAFIADDLARSPRAVSERMRTIPSIAPFMALTYASIGAVHGLLALSVREASDDGPLDASADASMDASCRGDTAAAAALARWSVQGDLGQTAGPLLRRALPACNLLLLLRSLNLAAATGETLLPALGAALSLGPFCASAWLCPQLWRLAARGKLSRADSKALPADSSASPVVACVLAA